MCKTSSHVGFQFKILDDILNRFMDGSWVFRDRWKETDQTIYMNSLGFFWGSSDSTGESTESLENSETGRKLFCATMSVEKYSKRQPIFHLNSVGQVDTALPPNFTVLGHMSSASR